MKTQRTAARLTQEELAERVETTKHVIEPSESLLGKPKSVDEIADYIDADIVED